MAHAQFYGHFISGKWRSVWDHGSELAAFDPVILLRKLYNCRHNAAFCTATRVALYIATVDFL